jgi:hypothetical protein
VLSFVAIALHRPIVSLSARILLDISMGLMADLLNIVR